jgi:hypothetical protein
VKSENASDGDESWMAQERQSARGFLEGTPVRREESEGASLPVPRHAKRALPTAWRAEHGAEDAGGIRTPPRGTDDPRVLYPRSETCSSGGSRECQAATSLADDSVKLLERSRKARWLHGWRSRHVRERVRANHRSVMTVRVLCGSFCKVRQTRRLIRSRFWGVTTVA